MRFERIGKWRWLRRTVLAVFCYMVVRTVWLLGERETRRSKGDRAYIAAVAETEATDPEWRFEQLAASRKMPPPERNSTNVILKVVGQSPSEWQPRNGGKKWEPAAPALPANSRFPEQVVADVRKALTPARAAVELALTIEKLPEGYAQIQLSPDVISTMLPHVDAIRFVQSLLQSTLVLALEDGDDARAASAVKAMLNTSRSIGDEFFLISQLVRMSTRVTATRSLERLLAQARLSNEDLAVLQAAWATDADEPLLLYAFRGERALTDVMLANLIAGNTQIDGVKNNTDSWFSRYASWLFRVKFMNDRIYLHRYLTQSVEIAKAPIHEQAALLVQLPEFPDPELKVAGLFLPAVEKCAGAYWRTTAEMRCAIIGLACERFRLRNGRWPETLAELPKDQLAAHPLDPFGGKSLEYRLLQDGVVVHSIGQRATGPSVPPHLGLPDGIEIGFRLWNPEARRQPPPAEPKVESVP